MKKWISTVEKRNFIHWILENHRLKNPDAKRLLEYIHTHHHLLQNISFVEDVSPKGKTMVISAMNTEKPGFLFYEGNRSSSSFVSKAMDFLMANPSEKLYMILHFVGKTHNNRYLQLIESPLSDNINRYNRFEKYSKEATSVIEKINYEQKIAKLKRDIDDALDQKDSTRFKQLVEELNRLQQEEGAS